LLRLFVACALLLADSRNTREHCGERSMVVVAVHSNPVFAVSWFKKKVAVETHSPIEVSRSSRDQQQQRKGKKQRKKKFLLKGKIIVFFPFFLVDQGRRLGGVGSEEHLPQED
jgi:hypothetical protein